MKLSTVMLVLTGILFLGVLTAYNLSLKAAYAKGTFRNRFGEHTFRQLNNVKQIQVKSANMMGLSIEHGDREGVWINDRVKNLVKVKQSGETVIVDLINADSTNYRLVNSGDLVMIVNKLNQLSTENHQLKGKGADNYGGEVNVIGLKGESFTMLIDEQSSVKMTDSKIRRFKAKIGGDRYWSGLIVSSSNHFDTAYFDVIGKSSLQLQNPDIKVPYYKFGDSSRVELWGRSAQRVSN